jgi:hypothetical protein
MGWGWLAYSGLGSSGGDDDRVLHGVVLLQRLDELSNGGSLLADGDVDAVELLGLVVAVVPPLLVKHGIESHGGLAGLTITDDQLTLATADGNHSVDRLETGLDRLVDGVAGKNAGGLELSTTLLFGVERPLAIDGVAERVDNTAEQLRADGDIDLWTSVAAKIFASWILTHDFTGTLHGLSFLHQSVRAKQHNTDLRSRLESSQQSAGTINDMPGLLQGSVSRLAAVNGVRRKVLTMHMPFTPEANSTSSSALTRSQSAY